MKKALLFTIIVLAGTILKAQKVDSIYFHLYTDSLKKCQHNYINVDGKLATGIWSPLTEKDIEFSSPDAKFEGNQLVIPCDFKGEKVNVKAVLKSNKEISIERTIWIKKIPDPEFLPTAEDILRGTQPAKTKKKKKKN
jgi:hypothetical protein